MCLEWASKSAEKLVVLFVSSYFWGDMSAITGVATLQPQVNFSSFSAYSYTHTHGEHAVVHEENLPDQECGDTGFCQNAQQCAHRDWKTLRKSNLFLFKSRSRVT